MFTEQLAQEQDERNRFQLQILLTRELLLAGETERAIDRLKQLIALFDGGEADRKVGAYKQVREWLALAYMRLGEQDNCVAHHGVDSCLMPIRGDGVHANPRGSRGAIARATAGPFGGSQASVSRSPPKQPKVASAKAIEASRVKRFIFTPTPDTGLDELYHTM